MSTEIEAKLEPHVEDLLKDFDFIRWSVTCRMMMTTIAHGLPNCAHNALDAFIKNPTKLKVDMDSPVRNVFDSLIANKLESLGLMTVAAVDRVSNATLMQSGYLGVGRVSEIRDTVARVKAGQQFEDYGENLGPVMSPEYFATFDELMSLVRVELERKQTEPLIMSAKDPVTAVLDALTVLRELPPDAGKVLDKRIADLERELNQCRKARAVITSFQGAAKPSHTPDIAEAAESEPDDRWADVEQKVYLWVKANGEATCKQLAEALGVSAIGVGKAVASSARLKKRQFNNKVFIPSGK